MELLFTVFTDELRVHRLHLHTNGTIKAPDEGWPSLPNARHQGLAFTYWVCRRRFERPCFFERGRLKAGGVDGPLLSGDDVRQGAARSSRTR